MRRFAQRHHCGGKCAHRTSSAVEDDLLAPPTSVNALNSDALCWTATLLQKDFRTASSCSRFFFDLKTTPSYPLLSALMALALLSSALVCSRMSRSSTPTSSTGAFIFPNFVRFRFLRPTS